MSHAPPVARTCRPAATRARSGGPQSQSGRERQGVWKGGAPRPPCCARGEAATAHRLRAEARNSRSARMGPLGRGACSTRPSRVPSGGSDRERVASVARAERSQCPAPLPRAALPSEQKPPERLRSRRSACPRARSPVIACPTPRRGSNDMAKPGGNPIQVLYLFLACCVLAGGVWAGLQSSGAVQQTPSLPVLCSSLLMLAAVLFAAAAWIHTRH